VDIQLYDTSNVRPFPEGKAIVAFCAAEGCNRGVLGMDAGVKSMLYNQRIYTYSGYQPDPKKPGHEYIEIQGDTNTPLIMRAYGFQAGKALVTYSWWNSETSRVDNP